jgi:hypothetical protein
MFPRADHGIRTPEARFWPNMHPLPRFARAKAKDAHRPSKPDNNMHISCKSPEKEWNTFNPPPICNIWLASN